MKRLFVVLVMLVAMNVNAQWVQSEGVYGGNVHSLAISGNNIFAGTEANGIFLSTNTVVHGQKR